MRTGRAFEKAVRRKPLARRTRSNWNRSRYLRGQAGGGEIWWSCWIVNPTIAELTQAIEQEVEKCPEAQRLMTHPGVGPLTGLGFVLIIGTTERFRCGKQIASYLGLVSSEESSGEVLQK
jgi:transposase IS116/IS110/IS902 family protein